MLIEIRTGQWSLDRLSNHVNQLFAELDGAENASALPDTADRKRLSTIVVETYINHWRSNSAAFFLGDTSDTSLTGNGGR